MISRGKCYCSLHLHKVGAAERRDSVEVFHIRNMINYIYADECNAPRNTTQTPDTIFSTEDNWICCVFLHGYRVWGQYINLWDNISTYYSWQFLVRFVNLTHNNMKITDFVSTYWQVRSLSDHTLTIQVVIELLDKNQIRYCLPDLDIIHDNFLHDSLAWHDLLTNRVVIGLPVNNQLR